MPVSKTKAQPVVAAKPIVEAPKVASFDKAGYLQANKDHGYDPEKSNGPKYELVTNYGEVEIEIVSEIVKSNGDVVPTYGPMAAIDTDGVRRYHGIDMFKAAEELGFPDVSVGLFRAIEPIECSNGKIIAKGAKRVRVFCPDLSK